MVIISISCSYRTYKYSCVTRGSSLYSLDKKPAFFEGILSRIAGSWFAVCSLFMGLGLGFGKGFRV